MAWLTGWNRRKSKTIIGSTTSAQSNYQMMLILHKGSGTDSGKDIYLGTNVKDDFSDVRFTKPDQSTLLDYWTETYTSGSVATVWIKLAPSPDSIPISPGTYTFYVYYDNPSPPADGKNNGNNTFVFFDHFDDLTKWTYNSADASITPVSQLRLKPIGTGGGSPYTTGSIDPRNKVIEWKVKAESDVGNGPQIMLNKGPHYVRFFFSPSTSRPFDLQIYADGSQVSGWDSYFAQGSWYNLQNIIDDTNNRYIMVNRDNTSQSITQNWGVSNSPVHIIDTSYINFYRWDDPNPGYEYIEHLFVRNYIAPEPGYGATGSEETAAGSLSVSSTPSGASIYIDTILQTGTTPTTITGLTAGNHTYLLRLSGYADSSGSFSITPGTTSPLSVTFPGSLSVSSTPSGASIYIDTILQTGTTPAIITGLTAGSHTYRLTLTGYADVTGSFSIIAGTTTTLSISLVGNLNISSTPSGASIYIDTILQTGTTPAIITGIHSGSHTYRLTLIGYADSSGSFSITPGTTTPLSVTFLGSLSISSTPSGASIYIDTFLQIGTTPRIITGLSDGNHNVKLILTNYYDYTTTTTITAGQTTTLNPTLIPQPGSLNISSTPSGSKVFIDNIDQGITTPIIIGNLTVGPHTIKLTHLDYQDLTGINFNIYSNMITLINATLDPVPGIPPTYATWEPTKKARLRIYKCRKIDISQTFLVDASTLSFNYEITADAEPEIIRWQLIVAGTIVIDEIIPSTPYGTSTGTITKDLSNYLGSNATIKIYVESSPDCKLADHENTYLWIDNVKLI